MLLTMVVLIAINTELVCLQLQQGYKNIIIQSLARNFENFSKDIFYCHFSDHDHHNLSITDKIERALNLLVC